MQGAAQDMWQAFLFAPRDEWADVQIPMARFLKTWRGRVLDGENEMNARRVLSLGISLAGGGALEPPGPYRLGLKHIVARIGARQTQRE
jgi:NADH dehydrogenase [ubiquinone] 1 alpha subcomplex assembly factor 1